MADVQPFRGILPAADKAAEVAAPPYDVMDRQEAVEMVAGKPLSFLRVTRSEVELPENVDVHDEQVYKKARETYARLKQTVPFTRDEAPEYYIYSLTMNGHRQTGIVATPTVDDYDNDVIKKHEHTRPEKEDDRTRHIVTVGAQTGPVFLTYRDRHDLDQLTERVTAGDPLFDFTADDGISHTVWRAPRELVEPIRQAFAATPDLYIADGHHRAASASRARAEKRHGNSKETGDEDYNRFLCVIFPASQLQILPYNRVVKDLNGMTAEALRERIAQRLAITPAEEPEPERPATFHMYLGGRWWKLACQGNLDNLSVVDRLDVSLLQNNVLQPLLGIGDPRTDDRIDFVGGIRGTGELEKRVDRDGGVAFAMYPTTVEQLMAISDENAIMPPKSTWFEPKLRDGLVVHEI